MEKEQKARNETSKQNEENQTQNNSNKQQSFLGEASFSQKEGSVGSNPTPPVSAYIPDAFTFAF